MKYRTPKRSQLLRRALITALLAVFVPASTVLGDVVINEVMSSNISTVFDAFAETSDWIELHNNGTIPVNMSGFGLSDDPALPRKLTIGTVSIPAGGYLLVFASDRLIATPTAASPNVHAPFKLSADGEEVVLCNAAGAIIDRRLLPALAPDISLGRDGSADGWGMFDKPTPGAVNGAGSYDDIVSGVPLFSVPAGFRTAGTAISLTSSVPGTTIRYTTDCSTPTASSPVYAAPIRLDSSMVIRARLCKPGALPGSVATATYLVNETCALSVVSLTVDPTDLWDSTRGIYVKWEQDNKVPAHVELFEKNKSGAFSLDADVSLAGSGSRGFAQRSFNIELDKKYGMNVLNYALFPDYPQFTSFTSFSLKNGGMDWCHSQIRDAFMTSLLRGEGLEYEKFRPVVVFLNGTYWGYYNLRERFEAGYFKTNFGIPADSIDILKTIADTSVVIVEGTDTAWHSLASYVQGHDITQPDVYDYVNSRMDIGNYIDYIATEVYYSNVDWPENNVRWWKHRMPGAKWRWCVWDVDWGFCLMWYNYTDNYLKAVMSTGGQGDKPAWSTQFFRTMIRNQTFKREFINRFADLLNGPFVTERVNARIDSVANEVRPEMTRHFARWPIQVTWHNNGSWEKEIVNCKLFGTNRPDTCRKHIRVQFGLSGTALVNLGQPLHGRIKVNSRFPREYPWSGTYFKGNPIVLTAVADSGYAFSSWSDGCLEPVRTMDLTRDTTLSATFQPRVAGTTSAATTGVRTAVTVARRSGGGMLVACTGSLARDGVRLIVCGPNGRHILEAVPSWRVPGRTSFNLKVPASGLLILRLEVRGIVIWRGVGTAL